MHHNMACRKPQDIVWDKDVVEDIIKNLNKKFGK